MEANKRLAWSQQQADKRVAAEYLVEQIRGNHEEKVSLKFKSNYVINYRILYSAIINS